MTTIIKGDICYSLSPNEISYNPDSFLVAEDGVCKGVFADLPAEYQALTCDGASDGAFFDYSGRLVFPGMSDLHIHAPQFNFRGIGMDKELIDWLNTYTFDEESKFADLEYAEKSYDIFARHMLRSVTTRFCAFASIHRRATLLLMDKLEATGLKSFVGKVNMDRNCPENYCESTEESVSETLAWLREVEERGYKNTKPIITPRFVPSCSDELLTELGDICAGAGESANGLAAKYPLQSHLCENVREIAWVRELVPEAKSYADAYHIRGCFGESYPCIMAHCVHMTDEELQLVRENGVFVAHAPESNANLTSGVAPVSKYLKMGIKVGLSTDIAAGSNECLLRAIAHAMRSSNLRWRLQDQETDRLTFTQAFYIATMGGGEFFGKVGSFAPGYEMDVIVMNDSELETARELSLKERLERLPHLSTYRNIEAKFVAGKKLI